MVLWSTVRNVLAYLGIKETSVALSTATFISSWSFFSHRVKGLVFFCELPNICSLSLLGFLPPSTESTKTEYSYVGTYGTSLLEKIVPVRAFHVCVPSTWKPVSLVDFMSFQGNSVSPSAIIVRVAVSVVLQSAISGKNWVMFLLLVWNRIQRMRIRPLINYRPDP